MKELHYPYSKQITLVIENYGKIVYFSLAVQATTQEEMLRQLKLRERHKDLDPLGFEFEHPQTPRSISFTQPYAMDVIGVDMYDNVLCTWTEPANHSKTRSYRTFSGLRTLVVCPEGLSQRTGIIPGVSKLTLRTSMSYTAIYYQEVWAKELKLKSDQEIIDMYNNWIGKGYMGTAGNISRSTLGSEIASRPFDSSLIIKHNEYGRISGVNFSKRVRLINNKLEFYTE